MGMIFNARNSNKKISGVGSPEGVRPGGLNTLYEDTASGDVYVKTVATGSSGWKQLGGGGSGGGGSLQLEAVAGEPGGPMPGTTVFQSNTLIGKTIDFIIANNIFEVSFGANPQFTFDSGTGTIDRAPAAWFAGDTLLIQYR